MKINLTKYQQKQYDKIIENLEKAGEKNPRRKITKKYFLEYFIEVRKARKKMKSLYRKGKITTLKIYSLKTDKITSVDQIKERRKKIKKINSKNYLLNYQLIENKNLLNNISNVLGKTKEVEKLKRFISTLSASNLRRMFSDYAGKSDEYTKFLYESDTDKLKKHMKFISNSLKVLVERAKKLGYKE